MHRPLIRPALLVVAALVACRSQPISEFAKRYIEVHFAGSKVDVQGPLTISLALQGRPAEVVDLTFAQSSCKHGDESCGGAIGAMVIEMSKPSPAPSRFETPLDTSKIRPSLRSVAFVDAIRQVFVTMDAATRDKANPACSPFVADLLECYVVDEPAGTRMVTRADADTLHVATDALAALARKNQPVATLKASPAGNGVFTIEPADPALMLRPEAWREVAKAVGEPLLVAAPGKAMVLAASGAHRAELVRRVEDSSSQPGGISKTVLRWTATGFVAK